MFDTGTRVIVTSSSFSGKTGPKRGSIGYALDMKVGDHETQFDSNNGWFVSLHRVIFVRYGFEENQRNETKFFINITPYLSNNEALEGKFDPDRLIEAKLDAIEKFDSTSVKLYDRMKYFVTSKFGKNYIHTGILVPTSPSIDLTKTSSYDFQAWVECSIRDPAFGHLVLSMVNNYNKINKIINGNGLVCLKDMIGSRAIRNDQFAICCHEPQIKAELITTIRKVLAIGERTERRKIRDYYKEWLLSNVLAASNRKQLTAMNMVLSRLYSINTDELLLAIYKRNEGDTIIERKVDFMTRLIPRMVSHARALERVSN